jgi:serine/threonine protein kinase
MTGLRWMFRAGFVHRDISLGNLLRVQINPGKAVVQLTDFEYSKPIHWPRTDDGWKTVSFHTLRVEAG